MGAEMKIPLGNFFETAGWGDGFFPSQVIMHTSRAAHLHGLIYDLLPHHGDVQTFLRGDQMAMIVCTLVYDKDAMPCTKRHNRIPRSQVTVVSRRANTWLSFSILSLTGYGTVMYT